MNAQIDITGVILKTKRLTLRPWRETDLNDFFEYASVDGVGQMAGWKPHESREESARILSQFIEGKKTFALELNGKVVGSLGIERYNEAEAPEFDALKCREIGYVLSKAYWGRGLMPEAVQEAVRWLFEDVGLDAVFCGFFAWNRQSARVQEKCGFRFYKRILYETHMGTKEETCLNVIRKEEYHG